MMRLPQIFSRSLAMSSTTSDISGFRTVSSLREWRRRALRENKSVGFVPTMGALHDGHLSLIKHSLAHNELTVVSIFVNPAQFGKNEDLSTYPRTFDTDMARLAETSIPSLTSKSLRTTSAVFVPTVDEMYPSGISQDRAEQKGTFLEVLGYGHQLEGTTRPGFFRGVATVVTKLFNAVEPTHAYFGQKDIQQALLLRRMVKDTLLSHPEPQNLHIIPTLRSPIDNLALSSRNVYLSEKERQHAPALYASLERGKQLWEAGNDRAVAVDGAKRFMEEARLSAMKDGVALKLDYIELTDSDSFEVAQTRGDSRAYILSGAMWVGSTRLIDNLLLGDVDSILY